MTLVGALSHPALATDVFDVGDGGNMARNEALWLLAHERRSVEIAATFVARYRVDNLKSGDVSLLIGLLAKLGFSPRERGALNLPTNST